jgi:hypothetical protein
MSFTSVVLKPSARMFASMSAALCSRPVSTRMCPCGDVMSSDDRPAGPTKYVLP